jgi:hypothetical protein
MILKKFKKKMELTQCPHFLKIMKTCSLSHDGFYLPPPQHISKFCLTSAYKSCSICKESNIVEKNKIMEKEKGAYYNGRRRARRIPMQRKVLIRTCDKSGIVVGDFVELAMTVDYSKDGMRIVSSKQIPDKSLLLFNFDYDFLIPQLQGFAQVCWQKGLGGLPYGIEAGLEFKDDESRTALARRLES